MSINFDNNNDNSSKYNNDNYMKKLYGERKHFVGARPAGVWYIPQENVFSKTNENEKNYQRQAETAGLLEMLGDVADRVIKKAQENSKNGFFKQVGYTFSKVPSINIDNSKTEYNLIKNETNIKNEVKIEKNKTEEEIKEEKRKEEEKNNTLITIVFVVGGVILGCLLGKDIGAFSEVSEEYTLFKEEVSDWKEKRKSYNAESEYYKLVNTTVNLGDEILIAERKRYLYGMATKGVGLTVCVVGAAAGVLKKTMLRNAAIIGGIFALIVIAVRSALDSALEKGQATRANKINLNIGKIEELGKECDKIDYNKVQKAPRAKVK